MISERTEVGVAEESEGSFGTRGSDHSTPVAGKKGWPTLDDTQISDADDEDLLISRAELKGLTQAMTGMVKMFNMVLKRLKLDKEKDEGIRELGNMMKGILSTLEQCGEHKERRRRRRREPAEVVKRADRAELEREVTIAKDGYSKRKVVSPAEGMRVEGYKRP